MDHNRNILQLILDWVHVHRLPRMIISAWNLRRCNPASKVVLMVSVQYQLEYLPIVFQVQFNIRHGLITGISSSDDASPTRHRQ